MAKKPTLAFGSGSSIVVNNCQICNNPRLVSILFLGYLPPVNLMPKIGARPAEQPSYPAEWLYCTRCHLVQLGCIVDPQILFPPQYPYTSSTTKVLRENFAELARECQRLIGLAREDLVVDIGSNDGNLLSFFKEHCRVLGVTPEEIGKLAIERDIDTIIDFFGTQIVNKIIKNYGHAKIITATNVFAHMENIHEILDGIKRLLTPDGVFISESHYLYSLIKTLQYDTIYHEHMRYYSLSSIKYLLEKHELVVFHAKRIPSHGGSVRVYAARPGKYPINPSVKRMLSMEKSTVTSLKSFGDFKKRVVLSKLALYNLLYEIKKKGKRIYGIGAPSRGSTLVNYVGIDNGIVDCVLEIAGSQKIGNYVPGTTIPVLEESKLYKDQPDFALLLSWHIAEELAPKLKDKGFRGDFIVPLPNPKTLSLRSKVKFLRFSRKIAFDGS